MDVLGLSYDGYSDAQREAVVAADPRGPRFKEDVIQAFYDGIRHTPQTTFGNVKADVIADKQPDFHRGNFCSVIRDSRWQGRGDRRAVAIERNLQRWRMQARGISLSDRWLPYAARGP